MDKDFQSLGKAKSTNVAKQARVIITTLSLLCLGALLVRASPRNHTLEEIHQTPYEVQKSLLEDSARWMIDHSRKVVKKVPAFISKKDSHGSLPHEIMKLSSFQSDMYTLTAPDWKTYEAILKEFSRKSFRKNMSKWGISLLHGTGADLYKPRKMPSIIWQTGKEPPRRETGFQKLNPSSSYNFYNDDDVENWATKHFGDTLIKQVWDGMERIVLRADFWRYLIIFIEGGFYSDVDTDCLKPVDDWGNIDVVTWDLGDKVSDEVKYGPPQVVVGIEVDVPDLTGWETFWPRPVQIVQWTMSGAPGHPIYLDSIRRVVESMQKVKDWEAEKVANALKLFQATVDEKSTLKGRKKMFEGGQVWEEVRALLTVDPFDIENGGTMPLIEATGPGAFSDAVFSYLQARYGIHWSQLHNIQTATRIGDVAIVPITGFAPFQKPDWQRWKGINKGPMSVVGDITHSQALVNHLFSGSWRIDSDNNL